MEKTNKQTRRTKGKAKLTLKKETIRDLESKTSSKVKGGGGSRTACAGTQSDRNLKQDFVEIDARDVLSKIRMVPIHSWKYKWDNNSVKHIGPMAQDFFAVFGVGHDNKHVHLVDIGGVAFASIQALAQMFDDNKKQITNLRNQITVLKKRL